MGPEALTIAGWPRRLFELADGLLRGRVESLGGERRSALTVAMVLLVVIGGMTYGAAMGSLPDPKSGVRPLQMLYSGLKVPLLLLATFMLSLPSFYVANAILGLGKDFGRAVRALLATQVGLTIVLAAFAPLTWFWYVSGSSYDAALAFNAAMFGLASLSAQILLWRLYRPLIERDRRHLWMVRAWLVIYGFVGVQMGWVLRPFIGSTGRPTTFLREEAWGNAYLVLFDLFWRLVGG